MQKFQLAVLAMLVVLSGCRLYGGYDSEELSAEVLQQVVDQIAESTQIAKGELAIIQEAAGGDPALASLAESYSSMVDRNVELDAKLSQMDVSNDFKGLNRYRRLNRGLGAAISELYIIQTGYQKIKQDVAALRGVDIAFVNVPEGVPYEAVPPYYRRIKLASDVSMRTALGIN